MADAYANPSLSDLPPGSASTGAPSGTGPNTPSVSRENTNASDEIGTGTVTETPKLRVLEGKERSFRLQCVMFGNQHDISWVSK